MRSWSVPDVPRLPGSGIRPRLFDTAQLALVDPVVADEAALYVCGITPYDATHLGHAATYLAFDTLLRVWRDAGVSVRYAQNVTDIDDPLLERATATDVDWRELAAEQTELFRTDMDALSILPPDDFVAVTDVIEPIAEDVVRLLERGVAYRVSTPDAEFGTEDVYFDSERAGAEGPWALGQESNLPRETMLTLSAERGGDPERPGKRDPLDPLLWRAARAGEPRWDNTVLGAGRPGWHIECASIARHALGDTVTVQGGGNDLIFPHHEFSAGHASALTGQPFAHAFMHAGMIGFHGEKMSKSLGNLVLVSRLRADGVDPRAIRLGLLSQHYRADAEWTDDTLADAEERLGRWRRSLESVSTHSEDGSALALVAAMRAALANDLDTPRVLDAVDEAIAAGCDDHVLICQAIEALLGVRIEARVEEHHRSLAPTTTAL